MKTKRIQDYPNPFDLLAAGLIECKGKVYLDTLSRSDVSSSIYIKPDTSLASYGFSMFVKVKVQFQEKRMQRRDVR